MLHGGTTRVQNRATRERREARYTHRTDNDAETNARRSAGQLFDDAAKPALE
jgi:hypothetical protein